MCIHSASGVTGYTHIHVGHRVRSCSSSMHVHVHVQVYKCSSMNVHTHTLTHFLLDSLTHFVQLHLRGPSWTQYFPYPKTLNWVITATNHNLNLTLHFRLQLLPYNGSSTVWTGQRVFNLATISSGLSPHLILCLDWNIIIFNTNFA